MKRNPLRILLLLLLASVIGNNSRAQTGPPNTYNFYAYNETFTNLTSGTVISALTGQDDAFALSIPIGFNFLFCGSYYSSVTVNTNGWISFNSVSQIRYNDNQSPSTDLTPLGPCLLPLWDDPAAGTVSYATTGTAPNRVFTIEYNNMYWDWNASSPCVTYQVRLYEGGVIKYHYKQESGLPQNADPDPTRFGASIGIATSTSSFQFLNSTGTSPTTSTTTYGSTQWGLSTRPATGQVYQFGDFPCGSGPTSTYTATSITANISWASVPSTVGYEYAFGTSATPPTTGGTPTSLTTYNATGLTPNTQYYFHVRAKCTATTFTSWFTLPVKTFPPCDKPNGLQVKDLYLDSATVVWRKIGHALGYTYVVNTDRDDPTSSTNTTTGPDTFIRAKPLQEGTTYYVHIKVNCPGGETSNWLLDSFTTPVKCRPPQLKVDYEHIDRAIVYWNNVPSALKYEYEISQSPTPLGKGTEITNNSFFAFPLKPGNVYYFHVRSKCLDQGKRDISDWGTTSFKTFALSVDDTHGKGDRVVYAYPNPVKDIITVHTGSNQGTLVMSDITGKIVYNSTSDAENMEIDMSRMAKGVYLLKYTGAEHTETIRLIKE